jgi:hypothetical protein
MSYVQEQATKTAKIACFNKKNCKNNVQLTREEGLLSLFFEPNSDHLIGEVCHMFSYVGLELCLHLDWRYGGLSCCAEHGQFYLHPFT